MSEHHNNIITEARNLHTHSAYMKVTCNTESFHFFFWCSKVGMTSFRASFAFTGYKSFMSSLSLLFCWGHCRPAGDFLGDSAVWRRRYSHLSDLLLPHRTSVQPMTLSLCVKYLFQSKVYTAGLTTTELELDIVEQWRTGVQSLLLRSILF
jgi:hypothetical protein